MTAMAVHTVQQRFPGHLNTPEQLAKDANATGAEANKVGQAVTQRVDQMSRAVHEVRGSVMTEQLAEERKLWDAKFGRLEEWLTDAGTSQCAGYCITTCSLLGLSRSNQPPSLGLRGQGGGIQHGSSSTMWSALQAHGPAHLFIKCGGHTEVDRTVGVAHERVQGPQLEVEQVREHFPGLEGGWVVLPLPHAPVGHPIDGGLHTVHGACRVGMVLGVSQGKHLHK